MESNREFCDWQKHEEDGMQQPIIKSIQGKRSFFS
jgi:hypothetical protein